MQNMETELSGCLMAGFKNNRINMMIKNYILIALRNIQRQKIYSIITISGLIVGLTVFIFFALMNEFLSTFNEFHQNANRIYSVVQVLPGGIDGDQHNAITPSPLKKAMLEEYPEIESASRFFPTGRMIVKHQDIVFYESGIRFVDPEFLSIFSFNLINGNSETALSKPYSIVLTQNMANKYFGDENPIGKSLTLNNKTDVTITGIAENVPKNSSIRFSSLVSIETANELFPKLDDWESQKLTSILMLTSANKPIQLENKFSGFLEKYYPESPQKPKKLYLHSLNDFFLNSQGIKCQWGSGGANFTVLWIVAALLLIIAIINFMNLSTARYVTRANEVGVRKVIGAKRFNLINQFMGESFVMSFLALPIAIILFEILRPIFVTYIDDLLVLSLWDTPHILLLVFVVTVFTGILAGSYPAFYLSAFKPINVLKGKMDTGKKGGRLRKILVVVQFSFSIILILMTVVSIQQSNHNLNLDLGFERENIITVEVTGKAKDNLEIMKKELLRHNDIASVSATASLPIDWEMQKRILPEGAGEDESLNMNVYDVDYGFIEMLNIQINEGRSFSLSHKDKANFVINETAVEQLQWINPIGKRLKIDEQTGTVVGVAKDYHFKSLYFEALAPAILNINQDNLNYMLIKCSSTQSVETVIEYVKYHWQRINPDLPFEQTTLDQFFEDSNSGDNTAEMAGFIGTLAILLSCLGLFGLSTFAVERRIKEIGIRKVLGASIAGITKMLISKFLKLVVIANIIALPIAWYLMNMMIQFLYAYPINIGFEIFFFTTLITLIVAFITVSSQTLKTALINPIDSLRYE
jgi:putative ABC transport system permease protein